MSFRHNARVARSYVSAQQLKGFFMANAQLWSVSISGMCIALGVVFVMFEQGLGWVFIVPSLLVGAFVAVLIEAMNIIATSGIKHISKQVKKEINTIKALKGLTEEEKKREIASRQSRMFIPIATLVLFIFLSLAGNEMFWHSITLHAPVFFQYIGYVLGAAVSLSLSYIELHGELIALGVESSISSSALIFTALDMDAKQQILDELSVERSDKIKSAEFRQTIGQAAHMGLLGVLAETISSTGHSVSAEQLGNLIQDKSDERQAAQQFLNAPDSEQPVASMKITELKRGNGRAQHTEQERRAKSLIKKYGANRILENVDKYIEEAEMSRQTLVKYCKQA